MKTNINFQPGTPSVSGNMASSTPVFHRESSPEEQVRNAYNAFIDDFSERTTNELAATMRRTGISPEKLLKVLRKRKIPENKMKMIKHHFGHAEVVSN